LPLTDSEAFARKRPKSSARFFDVTLWQGRVSLAVFALVAVCAIYAVSRRSPYDAALVALLLPIPLPLFVTALSSQLPHARADRKRAWLCKLHRRLSQVTQSRVVAWARFPDGEARPDELRLRILGSASVQGLMGIEIAYNEAAPDQLATVTLIIRAKENSLAQRVWQDRLVWQRGRRADERVALHDLDWPVIGLAVDTVQDLLGELAAQSSAALCRPSPRSKASRSSGSGSTQSKAGTPLVPRQVMRRA
jgi:hypothetical protein